MASNLIIPTAEPFFFPGGDTACLLVHGFTGTPKEMRWMGEYLSGQGHTVLGIRLAGHATSPEDLLRVAWKDWLTGVEDGLNLLGCAAKKIVVVGLSMGGVLALIAANRYPVAGVVAISTPYALPEDWRLRYLHILQYLVPGVGKGKPDWHNPDAGLDHIDYPTYPTRAVQQLNLLMAEMRATLPQIHVPVLLVHSKQDRGVRPENAERIFDSLGTSDRAMLWVENSGHVIPREPDRQIVFEAAEQFIRRVSAA